MATNHGNAEHYLERIENLHGQIDQLRDQCRVECKQIQEDIQTVYREAKDEGLEAKALKGLVKYRALERKQDKIADRFDENERAAYDDLLERLGPLGQAAAEASGYYRDNDQDQQQPHQLG